MRAEFRVSAHCRATDDPQQPENGPGRAPSASTCDWPSTIGEHGTWHASLASEVGGGSVDGNEHTGGAKMTLDTINAVMTDISPQDQTEVDGGATAGELFLCLVGTAGAAAISFGTFTSLYFGVCMAIANLE
jgi:hypothetical protein